MPGHPVRLGSRDLRVDVAFGGVFYAIVDTEAVGIPLTPPRVGELRRLAIDLTSAVNDSLTVTHPQLAMSGVAGVVFTGPPQDPESHLRVVSVSGGGAVNWCPGGTAMSAIMSVLDAMQLLPEETTFVQEGLLGTVFHGRIIGRSVVGEWPALVTEIEGSAWITGEHTFVLDDDDPFKEGVSQP
jgi:proline racemase